MSIEWDKTQKTESEENTDTTPEYIANMQNAMDEICQMLSEESRNFKPPKFFAKMYSYISNNDRLLYTNITNYIFTLSEEIFGKLQTNIDSVVSYMYMEACKNDYKKDLRKFERTQRSILKMWDHINLARKQYIMFNVKDDKYESIVDEKMENVGIKISKEMNTQLISLVSIFTALSFLLFGGISSLDNILDGAKDIPILKLLLIGNIWCICIMNLIFTFMFFIAKLTNLNIKSNDDVNANTIQKYPYIWWCNWILCSSGIIFAWIYYLKRRQLLCLWENQLFNNSGAFVIMTSIFIGLLILLTGIYIVHHAIKGKEKSERLFKDN